MNVAKNSSRPLLHPQSTPHGVSKKVSGPVDGWMGAVKHAGAFGLIAFSGLAAASTAIKLAGPKMNSNHHIFLAGCIAPPSTLVGLAVSAAYGGYRGVPPRLSVGCGITGAVAAGVAGSLAYALRY